MISSATNSSAVAAAEDEGDDRGGRSIPVRSGRSGRRRGDADERLSEHAQELLQHAAQRAVEFGRREVDTEHLLLALTESDVVRTILEQFKVSVDDLRRQLEEDAPRGEREAAESGEIGVTPRVKSVIGRAFAASGELGHSYIGPEHFLIGLAEEDEGIAGLSCAVTD
jgi:ATP-dependent Clp protease ATP-binding subunit ClpC